MAEVEIKVKGLKSCDSCNKLLDIGERYFGFSFGTRKDENVHFCEECYTNLSCSNCSKKIEKKSFRMYYCGNCKKLHTECEDCMKIRLRDENKQKIWLKEAKKLDFARISSNKPEGEIPVRIIEKVLEKK